MVGNILTGLFAQASVAAYDVTTAIEGGWLDHHYIQLGYQVADSVTGFAYSLVVTTIILWAMHFFPGGWLRLRCDEETEILGVDDAEMGEFAYDYVGIEAELGHRVGAEPGVFSDNRGNDHTVGGGREPRHSLGRVYSKGDTSVEKEAIRA